MGKMLVINGRMAVNGGRMVTTDASSCCCNDDCCTPLASCRVLTPCEDPESCSNGCTLLPGSIARINSFSASYNSGNVIRSVSFSGATLKACQNVTSGFSAKINLTVTLKGGLFGRTYSVPVCWDLITSTGSDWSMNVRGGSFDVTDSLGTGDTYTIAVVPFIVDQFGAPIMASSGCGSCEGYPVPTISGSRVMAFYVTHKNGVANNTLQPISTATQANWTGGTNFDVFGTVTTDADCNGCPADVYYVWKNCLDSGNPQTVWATAEGCAQAPFLCQVQRFTEGPLRCMSFTGQTVPSLSIPPVDVVVLQGSICGDSTKTPPTYTCCKCLAQSFSGACCDQVFNPFGPEPTGPCPCHASASATITHTGGGTVYYDGLPHTITIAGSYTATRTACGGWNITGNGTSTITGPVVNITYDFPNDSGFAIGWTPFNCGGGTDTGYCRLESATCTKIVHQQVYSVGADQGTHTITMDITYTEGACKSTACSGGSGSLAASGYDGSLAALMRYFGSK